MKFLITNLGRRIPLMAKKKKTDDPYYEAWKKQRGDWGEINPVTKIIPNKKKNQKEKHRGKQYDDDR
jgi:hypothetical protein